MAHEQATPITVAAVDDHAIVLRGLEAALADVEGMRLVGVASGVAELLELLGPLGRAGDAPDVVVLDVDLRDGSQPERNVAALVAAGARIVLYTSEHRPALLRRVLTAGAGGVVLKDDPVGDLIAAIRSVARGEVHVNSSLAGEILADPVGAVALSPRERDVLALLAAGLTWSAVASALHISISTARTHMAHVLEAFAEHGLPLRDGPREAVARALSAGHIADPYASTDR